MNILTFDTTTNLHAVTLDGHLGALFTDVVTPRPDACYHAAVAHAGAAAACRGQTTASGTAWKTGVASRA